MEDWYTTPAGDSCLWCDDLDTEPCDDREAERLLCRGHLAEYVGTSLAGLDRMESAERADMAELGMFDR